MKLATTTSEFTGLCDTYRERLSHVREAGFHYVDLSMYRVARSTELLTDPNWRDNLKAIQEHAEALGLTFIQAHAPGGNYFAWDQAAREEFIAHNIRAIEVCKELGIPNIVVHAESLPGWGKKEFYENNLKFYALLHPAMERTGVNVLVENSTNVNLPQEYFVNSGKQIREFVEYLNHPQIHICWDTGHGNCEGMQREELAAAGKELYGVHINDNDGTDDQHTIPYLGTMNMDDIMHGLADAGYQGYFTFESSNALRFRGERRVFEEENRLNQPSLYLQKHIESFMYHVGVHILSAYGCFEE